MTAEDYVRGVDRALGDLPWSQRRDLVAELREHLAELPAKTNFRERLGTPEQYAAELRAAAGLERRHGVGAYVRARRPRNLILTVFVVTAIVLIIGSVVWIRNYQPLRFDGNYTLSHQHGVGALGEEVNFRKGRPFEFGMEVVNSGRFAVRVLGVPYGDVPWKARLMILEPSSTWRHLALRRFKPFDLQPGHTTYLLLKGAFACDEFQRENPDLESQTLFIFPVRYSFLWHTTTAIMPLPDKIVVNGTNKGCR